MLRLSHQRGGALVMILVAIALLGAVSFAVMRNSGTGLSFIDAESQKIENSVSTAQTYSLNMAVSRLKARGCSDDQISYETPHGNNPNPDAPADKSCHLYHLAGAGLKFSGDDPDPCLSGPGPGCFCALPWGGTVDHGESEIAFQAPMVPYGATCSSQTRTCTDGILSGTHTNQSCAPEPGANCTAAPGGTVLHGDSRTYYAAATVPYGSTCQSQNRVCENGSLSGSYTVANCAAASPANCTSAPGGTINHGSSRTYYVATSVPYGSTCSTQERTCTNGSLSGSYTATSCYVQAAPPANCNSAPGGMLYHGQSRTYYASSSVPCGGSCASQTRTCNNGSLSGSYTATSCNVGSCCAANYNQACNYDWDAYISKGCMADPSSCGACAAAHASTGYCEKYRGGSIRFCYDSTGFIGCRLPGKYNCSGVCVLP